MYKFIAHRGLTNFPYKENTKEAIFKALEMPYTSGVEFDIRKTKDNKLIVIHDNIINFESNGSGIVKHMTLKEIKKYNFGTKKYPSKISTLDEILKNIKSNKLIIIESKIDNIEKLLYKTIKKYKKLNIYIASFNYDFVLKFKKKYSQYKVGLIMGNIINKNKNIKPFDFISIHYNLEINTNKEIMIWPVNDEKILKKLNQKNYIVTDKAYELNRISTINSRRTL